MRAEFTAIVKKDGDWWLGWVEEVPGANAQEKTKEELLDSLREATNDISETVKYFIIIKEVNNYDRTKSERFKYLSATTKSTIVTKACVSKP